MEKLFRLKISTELEYYAESKEEAIKQFLEDNEGLNYESIVNVEEVKQ